MAGRIECCIMGFQVHKAYWRQQRGSRHSGCYWCWCCLCQCCYPTSGSATGTTRYVSQLDTLCCSPLLSKRSAYNEILLLLYVLQLYNFLHIIFVASRFVLREVCMVLIALNNKGVAFALFMWHRPKRMTAHKRKARFFSK